MLLWGKILGFITGAVNRILGLALGLFLLVLIAKPELITSSGPDAREVIPVDWLLEFKTSLALIGCLLIILNLNLIQFLLYSLWNTDVRRYISSKTTSGTARVSLDAIERSLKAAAQEVGEIERAKLRVYRIGAKRYKVEVRFWIPVDCNALKINERLRLILKKRFSELVSIEPDEKVFFEINLAGFKGRKKSSPVRAGGPPRDAIDTSQRQFKGPVYPVEKDS